MPGHDVIVVGASAGGVEALVQLVRALPADLPAAVFIVLHMPAHSGSVLPSILSRASNLPVTPAEEGQPLQRGRIYVATPDCHLLLTRGQISLSHGPTENGHRPAIDALFRTAARSFGSRVVGVVLSGLLDDGTAGLIAVKGRGGLALVQDPEEALYSSMPRSAIENVPVDFVLPIAGIAEKLTELAAEPAGAGSDEEVAMASSDAINFDSEMAEFDTSVIDEEQRPGKPSVYGCPFCHGALWEVEEQSVLRFRCRVGHAYTASSLLSEQVDSLDAALWTALRALKESGSLARRMEERAHRRGHHVAALRFARQVTEAEERAVIIENVLMRGKFTAEMDGTDADDNGGGARPGPSGSPGSINEGASRGT